MKLQLVEGQDLSANFTLLQCIARRDDDETWLALDRASSERVQLRIFSSPLEPTTRAAVQSGIAACRGLIHPNIARSYALESVDGIDFIVSQYIRSAQPYMPDASSAANQWNVLRQLLDLLEFAHGLGIAHGHLHPGNLLVNDGGMLYVTGFGLPAQLQDDQGHRAWISPQVRRHESPDPGDDIFSIGQMLYRGLTGQDWHSGAGFETSSPIPDELRHLVSAMLSEAAWARTVDLDQLRDVARAWLLGERETPLQELASFSRAGTQETTTATTTHKLPRERHVMSAPVAFGIFAVLIIAAGIVFFVLPPGEPDPGITGNTPSSSPDQENRSAESPTQAKPALTPLELARQKEMQEQGSKIASELLRRQVALEDKGVQVWAPADYKKVLALSRQGDDAYRDNRFKQALDLYSQAVSVLKNLDSQVDSVKAANLANGKSALSAGDFRTAIQAYTIVNAIDSDNKDAKHQLDRAENLEEVLALVKEGEFFENEGRLNDARQKFSDAADLDPEWQRAGDGLDRINHKIAKQKFDDAMSVAFTALGNHQYDKARDAFRKAQSILPASGEPSDGLEQVAIAQRQEKIDALKDKAASAMSGEDWAGAISTYKQILGIDKTLVFANKGLARAKARLDLEKSINRYLAQPTLMESDEELGDARQLLVKASRLENPGPKLQKQLNDLSELISLARIPVNVELRSDNHTDVTVYKVGHLGKLESTSLKLVPGQYIIVGQRPGYRDVQQVVKVLGGNPPDPVYVRCTDKI